jgi:hypothetical protein
VLVMKRLLLLLCLSVAAAAQVSVIPAPTSHIQFLDANGKPLAGGKVFTYAGGTTNLLNTYIDSTGTSQNVDPVILDAGGYANIWLANAVYKFCVYNFLTVLQYPCVDNIPGASGSLVGPNTWNFAQTFGLPITILPLDYQIVTGFPANQTTLDFPPPAGNVILHFPNIADTVIARTTTDTLTNKTLTSPTLTSPTITGTTSINGIAIVNGPTSYISITNAASVGTTLNTLTKLTGAPSTARATAITDTGGSVGITVAGAGTSGSATIQQGGTASCVFDGATTAGDYVQISATVAGDCHDIGAGYPGTGQAIGRVLTTNGGGGTYSLALFPAELNTIGVPGGATPTFIAGAGAGTGPTGPACDTGGGGLNAATVCIDRGGQVIVTTGTGPNTNSVIFAVRFGGTYSNGYCTGMFSPAAGPPVPSLMGIVRTSPALQFEVSVGSTALTAATQYEFTYTCSFR